MVWKRWVRRAGKKISRQIKAMPRGGRRKLNLGRSLEKYRQRLGDWSPSKFENLRDAYLSTYEVYSTIEDIEDGNASCLDCFATTLMRVAREKGVGVKGVTSERKTGGEYLVREIAGVPRESVRCVYVGKYSYFGNREASIFAPNKVDYVYDEN